MDTGAQQAALPALEKDCLERLTDRCEPRRRIVAMQVIDLLLREIQHRLGQRAQLDQLAQEVAYGGREIPAQGAKCGARRLPACRVDEVGDGLGLGEVELPFQERAPRELTGFGEPCPRIQAGAQQLLHHHRSAMALELEHRLARIGVRRSVVERDSLVDALALCVAKRGECRMTRRWQAPEDRARDVGDLRPGDADYADAAFARWCGNGSNGVACYVTAWHGQVCRD